MNINEKIKAYVWIKEELEALAEEIFDYFAQYPILCSFYGCASYEYFTIDNNKFTIQYYDNKYDCYDGDNFSIPLKNIYDNTWKQYIDDLVEEKQEKIYHIKLKEKERKKQERMELYEQLRKEFEEENNEYIGI